MAFIHIPPAVLPPECEELREEVRAFLSKEMPHHRQKKEAAFSFFDPAFSRKLGERGWLGMTWPKQYGGHERSFLERYVVLEELLAVDAPIAAHWVADRQSGDQLIRFGTEEMRTTIVPGIARGEVYFCVGMSEPDAGSDLAGIRSRAERVPEGWRLNGTKIWNSAHHAHYMIALVRTQPAGESRHAGLSQLLIDLTTPGITIRPILNLRGYVNFNEVHFNDVILPADCLLGKEGAGWKQVSTELGFERSGPERYLSSIELLMQMLNSASPDNERQAVALGRLVCEARTLRRMSIGLTAMFVRREDPGVISAMVKDMGTTFEQRIPEMAAELFDVELGDPASPLAQLAAITIQNAPSFSLRGGSREVLRGMIAKGMGLR